MADLMAFFNSGKFLASEFIEDNDTILNKFYFNNDNTIQTNGLIEEDEDNKIKIFFNFVLQAPEFIEQ